MKMNVSVVRFSFCCNILISGKIIKELPGLVRSGTLCSCFSQFCERAYCIVTCLGPVAPP
jgi:hypothetical protein